jgi:hypothetical protein
MNPRTLNVTSDGSWATLNGAPRSALPTIVIRLSQTLLAEIDPTSQAPVEIQTLDYSRDRTILRKLIGEPGTDALDHRPATTTAPISIPFTPTGDWQSVLELAAAEWAMHWNPLPLDPALLSLDLVRAQHQAIHLTGELPDKNAAAVAYPAAQTLERLLAAGTVSPEAEDQVRQAIRAVQDSLPLSHTDTTPYTLPLPLTDKQIRQILDPAYPNTNALATGSPDWHLTGHGPAASAENSITVTQHPRNTRAITITVPTKPQTNPENTPTYQAFITDPETRATIAATTLAYDPAEPGVYKGHTIPQRPVHSTDQVDIRHYNNPNPPTTDPATRTRHHNERQATRTYATTRLQQSTPGSDRPLPATITELTHTGHLLILRTPTEDLDLAWFMLESSESVPVRGSTGAGSIFIAKDPATRTSFTMMLLLDGLWLAVISPGPRVDSSVLRWETRWSTGEVTRHECDLDSSDSVEIVPPSPDAVPVMIRSVDE